MKSVPLHTRRIRPCEGTAWIGSRIAGTIRHATAIDSMGRALGVTQTASFTARELSMVAVYAVIVLIVVVAMRVVLPLLGKTTYHERLKVQQYQARLARTSRRTSERK